MRGLQQVEAVPQAFVYERSFLCVSHIRSLSRSGLTIYPSQQFYVKNYGLGAVH